MRKAIGSAGLAAVISMGLLAAFPVMAWAAPVLPEGISAGSQSLAGMTAEEAKAAVEQYVDGLAGQKVILSVDGQDVETTARELGFHWSNTQACLLYTSFFPDPGVLVCICLEFRTIYIQMLQVDPLRCLDIRDDRFKNIPGGFFYLFIDKVAEGTIAGCFLIHQIHVTKVHFTPVF